MKSSDLITFAALGLGALYLLNRVNDNIPSPGDFFDRIGTWWDGLWGGGASATDLSGGDWWGSPGDSRNPGSTGGSWSAGGDFGNSHGWDTELWDPSEWSN